MSRLIQFTNSDIKNVNNSIYDDGEADILKRSDNRATFVRRHCVTLSHMISKSLLNYMDMIKQQNTKTLIRTHTPTQAPQRLFRCVRSRSIHFGCDYLLLVLIVSNWLYQWLSIDT